MINYGPPQLLGLVCSNNTRDILEIWCWSNGGFLFHLVSCYDLTFCTNQVTHWAYKTPSNVTATQRTSITVSSTVHTKLSGDHEAVILHSIDIHATVIISLTEFSNTETYHGNNLCNNSFEKSASPDYTSAQIIY